MNICYGLFVAKLAGHVRLLQFIPDFGRSSRICKNEESEVDIFQ